MIKCPNCGSTAQPHKVDQRECGLTRLEKYKCGCGCEFTAHYELKEVHINDKSYKAILQP